MIAAGLTVLAMTGAAAAQPEPEWQTHSAELMTRQEAIERALNENPGISAATEYVRAAEALAMQAGLRPNPTLDIVLENFAGSGSLSALDGAEATYGVTQEIELGGDRRARRIAAERDADAARIGAGLSELDLRKAVEIAFIDAQAAEAFAEVAQSRLTIASEFADAVDRRVRVARDPKAASARVSARLAEVEAALETARERARATKAALANFWGGAEEYRVETETFFNPALRERNSAGLPDIALAESLRDGAIARVEIERSRRVPNPSVSAGFRRFHATDDSAFVVGVSVPLPFWNSNTGAIEAARANQRRAELEIAVRERELKREINLLSSQVNAARVEITAFAERVVPNSRDALDQSLQTYRQGGLSYIEVLEAQRAFTEVREKQINALLTYHSAEAKLARLHGSLSSDNY